MHAFFCSFIPIHVFIHSLIHQFIFYLFTAKGEYDLNRKLKSYVIIESLYLAFVFR